MKLISDYFDLIRSSYPVVLTQASYVGAAAIDAALIGFWLGTESQAIVGFGISIWIPILAFCVGLITHFLNEASSFLSFGDSGEELGRIYFSAKFVVLVVSFALLLFSSLLYIIFYGGELQYSLLYVLIVFAGFPAALLSRLIHFILIASGNSRFLISISFFNIISNAVLTYLFLSDSILEGGGGCAGAGMSTCISMWLSYLFSLFVVRMSGVEYKSVFVSFFDVFTRSLVIFKHGMPTALITTSDAFAFGLTGILVYSLGEVYMAAFVIACNIVALLFIFPSSISIVLSSLFSSRLAKNGGTIDSSLVCSGFFSVLSVSVFVALVVIHYMDSVVSLYTNDNEVASVAVGLLYICLLWIVVDSIQSVCVGLLRSLGHYNAPLVLIFVSYWIVGVPSGYFLSNYSNDFFGVGGYWYGLFISILFSAISLLILLVTVLIRHRRPTLHL